MRDFQKGCTAKAMKQTQEISACWQNASWYAALTLSERAASLHTSGDRPDPSQKAMRRLQTWKAQKAFAQETLFAERLATDAIAENDLLALLAEPLAAVQSRYLHATSTPDWLTTLREAFEADITDRKTIDPSQESIARSTPYLQPIFPLIQRGLEQIDAEIQQLCQQYPQLPFDPQEIIQILFQLLPERLLAQLSKTFVLEMHVARIRQQLHGETPAERFADFVRQLSQKEKILSLLEEYPVLARQCVVTIEQWVHYAQELVRHLCADWPDICTTFTPEHDPGTLIEIQGGSGDPHREGRSVLKLKFSSGFQLLYKPRSLATDIHFQGLLSWLNERGTQPTFRPVRLIDRGSYGWSEFIHAYSCTSRDEVARFYERQGSYLALLYALNAVDIHVENVIAAGEHPILIDLEALFHPQVGGNDPTQPYYLSLISMDQSVFRVGLLPYRIWSNKGTDGVDLSGLGGQAGQMTPQQLPQWEAAGTDQMRLIRQHIEIPVKQNRPQLNGHDIDVLDYKDHIITGFTRTYRLLQERRDELKADILPRFAHDEVRLLLRPSQQYATLLTESFHPDLLRDALERDRFFDQLWREVELRPYLARAISAERRDLLRGDIPMFTTHPDDHTIFSSDGEAFPSFFDESGLQLVEQRLQHLDEQDLARQRWIIEAALATLLVDPKQVTGKVLQVRPTHLPVSHDRLLEAANAVGKRLDQLATCNDYGASWLGMSVVNERSWGLLPTHIDLYNGTSGIALFLGYLGVLTGEMRYTTLARLALSSVRALTEQQKKYPQLINIGVFDGIGSVIYLLTHLSMLWHEPALFQEAGELVEFLASFVTKDERLDVISGSAGCIMNLLSLYTIHPSPSILDVACQCGDRLLATAQAMPAGIAWATVKHEKPLGGFAHGTSGIALSLLRLANASGQERYRQAALDALAYDRSLFLPEQQNWADLRTMPSLQGNTERDEQNNDETQKRYSPMVAWCHGAAGIGLSRLGVLPLLDDATTRNEIHVALKMIIAKGLMDNHSLCHGALGNADILLTATRLLNEQPYQQALEHLKATILDSIASSGWVTGVPLGIETPGLMSGLAGIGYGLLRLAEPEKVPSVLLVSPPG
jgi:type 2 lantibiotic biosynthesis protein LanM